ncbi:MAG: hypothetical protein PF569_09650 [Candidatus Woesearchaeota archaeon]|jgi:hypothetical protein|nr:hypothetical protein [Candidatus Woesearchaeota archaeon]
MGTLTDILSDVDFYSFLNDLEAYGWFQYVFPFMLVYAVVLTILEKVTIFEDKKPVRVIISLVFGLFSVAFEISDTGETLGDLMITLFPGVTAFSMGILALYIVIAMLGVDITKFFGENAANDNKWVMYILGGLGLFVVVYYYARGFGWDGFNQGSELYDFFADPLLYILVVFGGVFYMVSKDDNPSKPPKKTKTETVTEGE